MKVNVGQAFPPALLALILTGCMVGPKYIAPTIPTPPAFKGTLPPAYNGDLPGAWQPASPQDAAIKGKWWEMFNEPELNSLEEELNIDNQTIAQYFQNFMAARAIVSEARAGLFPTVTVNGSASRSGTVDLGKSTTKSGTSGSTATSPATSPTTTSTSGGSISLPFDVSWQPDLWGRVRNTIRGAQYAAQVSAADLENQRLTEQANLAEYYFELRGEDALLDVNHKAVEAEKLLLDLTHALVETGIEAPAAIPQAEIALANAQQAGIGISNTRAAYEHAIATLIGKPAPGFSMPEKVLITPLPPIPVGVPSELLQRRPDIAAAERIMAEANATIGVATAAYYPSLSLTGSAGIEASGIKALFSMPALFWSLGASAAQTLFDAGLRNATVRQYTATYNADVASYKEVILTAFQQVEDYMSSLRGTSLQLSQQRSALDSAQTYVKLETGRYETGLDPYLLVVSAQLTLLSNQQTEIGLRIDEMTEAVQLIQALGGGWNVSQLPAPANITSDAVVKQVQ